MSALRKRPSAKHFGKAPIRPKRVVGKPGKILKTPAPRTDTKKTSASAKKAKSIVKKAGKAQKTPAPHAEAKKTLAPAKAKSLVKKAGKAPKAPALRAKAKKILAPVKARSAVKKAGKTPRPLALRAEAKKTLAPAKTKIFLKKAEKAPKPTAPRVKAKKTPASTKAKSVVRKTREAKITRTRQDQAKKSLVFNGQVGKTVTVTVTITTTIASGDGRSARSGGQAEETVIFEGPSARMPATNVPAERSVVRVAPTDTTAIEGQVEQPGVLDRPAGNGPGQQHTVETAGNLGGLGGKSAGQELRPRKKVLLIEDDKTMLKLLEMGLRTHDYDCLIAENGKAAQTLLQTNRPDVILVDLLMPVMDGLAFIQWLRQTAHNSTPVLVFTTVDNPKIMQEVLKSGADFFARKPLHLKELVETMDKLAGLTHREPRPDSA